ncbi:hypothetical protein ABIE49_005992 [Bradyrhizobium sp. OAE829]
MTAFRGKARPTGRHPGSPINRDRTNWFLAEQVRPGRGELHEGAALVKQQPTARDREIKAGPVFGWAGTFFIQHRCVDLFDVNAALLHRLDRVSNL